MPDTTSELVFIGAPDGHGPIIPVSASSGNVTNAAAEASIAAVASQMSWVTGFILTAAGATAAANVNATLAGVTGGTLTFTFVFPAGATVAATPLVVNFPNPIPSTAVNTAITVSLPAGGIGNLNASATIFGFRSKP